MNECSPATFYSQARPSFIFRPGKEGTKETTSSAPPPSSVTDGSIMSVVLTVQRKRRWLLLSTGVGAPVEAVHRLSLIHI